MSELNKSFQGFHADSWSEAIGKLEKAGMDYVLVTVLGTKGSTPRASGTKMVITKDSIFDTLGGGHLEFKIIEKSRELLNKGESVQIVEEFFLAASLGQCCGGATVVMFEAMINQRMPIDVYGAGHVAQALMPILGQLPVQVRWIDSRADVFPQHIPSNVTKVVDDEPVGEVAYAPANSAFLVLTHNHQLDFDLTRAVLKREDALWLGVIGSKTKAKRFQYRLAQRGFTQAQIDTMVSPVGLNDVQGKLPMEVAVSIAGQIINLYQHYQKDVVLTEGLQMETLNKALKVTEE